MKNIIERLADGSVRMNDVAVFTCGCGGVVPEARSLLRMAGVGNVEFVTTSGNTKVKRFIRSVGLDMRVPSLRRGRHSVLYNPFTGQYIDLLNAPRNGSVYENIFKVATAV